MAHGSYRPNKLESPAINQNCFQCRTEWTVLTTCTFNEIKPGYYGLTSLRFHSDAHCFLILQLYPAEGESEILSAGAISCYKAFFFLLCLSPDYTGPIQLSITCMSPQRGVWVSQNRNPQWTKRKGWVSFMLDIDFILNILYEVLSFNILGWFFFYIYIFFTCRSSK